MTYKTFHRNAAWKIKSCTILSAVLFIIVLSLSCKKEENPASPPIISVAGTWTGSYSTSLVPNASIIITLTQTSNNVSGTFKSQSGSTGTVSNFTATIESNRFDFSLEETTPDCSGTFTGTATVSGDTMDFTFSGSDCLGYHANGSGRAIRIGDFIGGDLIPLKVGNIWIMKSPNAPNDSSIYTDTVVVVKDTVLNNEQWYYVKGLDPTISYYLTNRSNGLWAGGLFPYLKWKYPAIKNEIYQSANDSIQVVSTNEILNTAAGQFKCYQYRTLNPSPPFPYPGDTYISPNTGFVRIYVTRLVRIRPLIYAIMEYELVKVILK